MFRARGPFVQRTFAGRGHGGKAQIFEGFPDEIERSGDQDEGVSLAVLQCVADRSADRHRQFGMLLPKCRPQQRRIQRAFARDRRQHDAMGQRRQHPGDGRPILVGQHAQQQRGFAGRKKFLE